VRRGTRRFTARLAVGYVGGVLAVGLLVGLALGSRVPAHEKPTVPVTAIAVSPNTAEIAVAETTEFTATGIYEDGSRHDISALVEWVSSDPRVASVDIHGLATALTTGAGEITASLGNQQDSALLTVRARPFDHARLITPPD
jgi:hypothetical protein